MRSTAVMRGWGITVLIAGLAAGTGAGEPATAAQPAGRPPAGAPPADARGPAPGEERITADDLSRLLTFLASPEFEGRESGARGGRAAARYMALQFTEAGLKPIGSSYLELDAAAPSYYQPFNIIRYRWDQDATTLRLKKGSPADSTRVLRMATDFLPASYVGDLEVSAPVVFAGYGITAPGLGYDDYAGLNARGKMVLAFAHEPEENREDSRWGGRAHTREASIKAKALNAQAHGAAALLVMPEPILEHMDFWTWARPWMQSLTMSERQALEAPEVELPIVWVKPHVGKVLFSAAAQDPERAQREIDSSGRPRSFAVPGVTLSLNLRAKETQPDSTANVIGLLEGSDPGLKDEVVVVGAHYDHTGVKGERTNVGADDDGSGTVALLEIARALASAGRRPRRSVLFAAWGAEEKGLLGSEFYAGRPIVPLTKTAAVINLDMIGRDEAPVKADDLARFKNKDTRNSVNLLGTAFSPDLRTLVGALNEGLNLDVDYKFDRDIEQGYFQRSDQWPFALRDVPTLFFFTGSHPDYHSPADTAIKINYGKMERIARLAYRLAWAIANADGRPKFSPIPAPAMVAP